MGTGKVANAQLKLRAEAEGRKAAAKIDPAVSADVAADLFGQQLNLVTWQIAREETPNRNWLYYLAGAVFVMGSFANLADGVFAAMLTAVAFVVLLIAAVQSMIRSSAVNAARKDAHRWAFDAAVEAHLRTQAAIAAREAAEQAAREEAEAQERAERRSRLEELRESRRREVERTGRPVEPIDPPAPQPFGVSPRGAEELVAQWMRSLGDVTATTTQYVGDGGIDVQSERYIAQVKHYAGVVGVGDVRQLAGVASVEHRQALFFTSTGYAEGATAFADQAGIGLFIYSAEEGTLVAVNALAEKFRHQGL